MHDPLSGTKKRLGLIGIKKRLGIAPLRAPGFLL